MGSMPMIALWFPGYIRLRTWRKYLRKAPILLRSNNQISKQFMSHSKMRPRKRTSKLDKVPIQIRSKTEWLDYSPQRKTNPIHTFQTLGKYTWPAHTFPNWKSSWPSNSWSCWVHLSSYSQLVSILSRALLCRRTLANSMTDREGKRFHQVRWWPCQLLRGHLPWRAWTIDQSPSMYCWRSIGYKPDSFCLRAAWRPQSVASRKLCCQYQRECHLPFSLTHSFAFQD